MQNVFSSSHQSGSTRGFMTADPERQGVLVSSLRGPAAARGGPTVSTAPRLRPPEAESWLARFHAAATKPPAR